MEKDGKLLLLDRKNPPYGLAGPAGHVDIGEEPLEALKREVLEETGLKVHDHKLLVEEFVPWNVCSKGVEGHHWYVYQVTTNGKIHPDKAEAKSIGWYDPKQVKDLEPVWQHWLKKLGYTSS